MDRQVAFVTYNKHPQITEDDALAAKALAQLGIGAVGIPWDRPGVDWSSFAAVVLRSCWDYFHHPERFLSWIDTLNDQGIMLLNDQSIVRWNAEKTYLIDLLSAGMRIVPTVYAQRGSHVSISSILIEQNWERVVIKPTISGTSLHTWVTETIGDKTSLQNDQLRLNSLLRERSMMLQEFFPEIETEGELSLIYFDGIYSHTVRKVPQAGDFRVQNEFGGTWNPVIPNESLRQQADNILRTSDCDAVYARIDGVVRGDSLFLMELEMIEPHLFLSAHPAAAGRFALSIASRTDAGRPRGAVRSSQ